MAKTDNLSSASNFHARNFSINKRFCLYSDQNDYYFNHCGNVANVIRRKEMLRKEVRCFVCIESVHLARNCTSKYTCHRCDCICASDKKEPGATHNTNASSHQGILLQTAAADQLQHLSYAKLF